MQKLTVLGAGSWGLTLAWLYSQNTSYNYEFCLWHRNPEKVEALQTERNVTFPVELTLPEHLHITSNLKEAIQFADVVLLAVTSAGTREVVQQMKATGALRPDAIIVNCSKGIELSSLKRLTDVIKEEAPENPVGILSGPNLAKEILTGLPTAATIASDDLEIAEYLQIYLTHDRLLRLYSSSDVTGVEMGGALKNIFAIASGFMKQRQLGDNAFAALITRGLAEMTRFCVAHGADPQTLYGLSGLGDMLATCNSPLSRNYQVGAGLAQGKSTADILTELRVVAEGVTTTEAVHRMAEKMNLDMPVVSMVYRALQGELDEQMIIKSLMSRKLKAEKSIS